MCAHNVYNAAVYLQVIATSNQGPDASQTTRVGEASGLPLDNSLRLHASQLSPAQLPGRFCPETYTSSFVLEAAQRLREAIWQTSTLPTGLSWEAGEQREEAGNGAPPHPLLLLRKGRVISVAL